MALMRNHLRNLRHDVDRAKAALRPTRQTHRTLDAIESVCSAAASRTLKLVRRHPGEAAAIAFALGALMGSGRLVRLLWRTRAFWTLGRAAAIAGIALRLSERFEGDDDDATDASTDRRRAARRNRAMRHGRRADPLSSSRWFPEE